MKIMKRFTIKHREKTTQHPNQETVQFQNESMSGLLFLQILSRHCFPVIDKIRAPIQIFLM